MTDAELSALLARHPTLYHMAERGSWPGIQRHGLRSTAALLDLFEITGPQRDTILRRHRPEGVVLTHPSHGTAMVRDQKPMSDAALRTCLTGGMDPADWYELLNGKVFFWLTRARLLRLLGGRAYRGMEHEVLEIDAAALVGAYRERVMLSPINSGATFALGPQARGAETFRTIAAYDFGFWRQRRPASDCVVELTVAHAVPNVARFVRRVLTMRGEAEVGTVFER